jgi:toxin YhaV
MSGKRKNDKDRARSAPPDAALGRPPRDAAPERPALPANAIVVNGWALLFWSDFRERWTAMLEAARDARAADPAGYHRRPELKFLRTVRDLVFEEIPRNPDDPQFRQGKTLGAAHTHWRRAKFHRRFRLFFRFHSASRTIIYAWLNDEDTLRKTGSRTDPYAVFRRMLERGAPPSDWDELVAASKSPPNGGTGVGSNKSERR